MNQMGLVVKAMKSPPPAGGGLDPDGNAEVGKVASEEEQGEGPPNIGGAEEMESDVTLDAALPRADESAVNDPTEPRTGDGKGGESGEGNPKGAENDAMTRGQVMVMAEKLHWMLHLLELTRQLCKT